LYSSVKALLLRSSTEGYGAVEGGDVELVDPEADDIEDDMAIEAGRVFCWGERRTVSIDRFGGGYDG
jgi:hypothetical protein